MSGGIGHFETRFVYLSDFIETGSLPQFPKLNLATPPSAPSHSL
jgi:hypothetical protein